MVKAEAEKARDEASSKALQPERGKIYIDGYDISKVDLSSIRRQVGIVPQDSLLFEGTVAENISLNDPQASTESVIEAAKIACAHDFIMDLPNGYATRIVEGVLICQVVSVNVCNS